MWSEDFRVERGLSAAQRPPCENGRSDRLSHSDLRGRYCFERRLSQPMIEALAPTIRKDKKIAVLI